MNRRIIAFAVAGGLMLSVSAFQRPTKANCDFRAAFPCHGRAVAPRPPQIPFSHVARRPRFAQE